MAYQNPVTVSLPADVDLSSYMFNPVWIGASSAGGSYAAPIAAAAQLIGSNTAPPVGVLQNTPIQGEAAQIAVFGLTKLAAYGTWAVGDPIGWNNSGQAIKALSTKFAFATAWEAATSGAIVTVFVNMARGVQ